MMNVAEATWKRLLLSVEATLADALDVIERGGLRFAMVIDGDERLLGVLTDGDVRRALLRRVSLDAPVTQAMNPHPVTARGHEPSAFLRSLMKERGLLHIPYVSPSGKLIGLAAYQPDGETKTRDNWVFLMAGGFGTRLQPLTATRPKPMLHVNGKPILEGIIESFIAEGFQKFYVSLHYRGECIRDHFGDGSRWGATIRYIEEETPLGTGGALGLLDSIDEAPIIMMNGDVLTRINFGALLDFHVANKAALTLSVREYDMQVPFGVVEGDESGVVGIVEKPVHRFFVNAGIYALAPELVARMKPPRKIDMPDVAQQLVSSGERVVMFPVHEYWLDIGRPDDFLRAQQEAPI